MEEFALWKTTNGGKTPLYIKFIPEDLKIVTMMGLAIYKELLKNLIILDF